MWAPLVTTAPVYFIKSAPRVTFCSVPTGMRDLVFHIYPDIRTLTVMTPCQRQAGQLAEESKKPYRKLWSLVANRDRILVLDQPGDFLLIRETPEEVDHLGEREISNDSTWAHLAVWSHVNG